MKTILSFIFLFIGLSTAFGQSYVVVASESRVFDQPNVKSYPTTNTSGADVILVRGMVFKSIGTPQNGWDKIEYTPGLNAFVLQSQLASASMLATPRAGVYNVANHSATKLTVTSEGSSWKASDGTSDYPGTLADNTVVFTDKFGNMAYSLVVMDGKPIVFSYNNDITKFF